MARNGLLAALIVVAFGLGYWWMADQDAGPAERDLKVELPLSELPGASLIPGLGSHHFQITTTHAEANIWFDQGLALTYGFNHDAAERSFLRAAELDSECAMCWMGAALVLGPHVNAAMDPASADTAWSRIQRALSLSEAASEREKAFIRAVATRYAENAPEDRSGLDRAYADALAELVQARPDDLDAATFYAEALMDLQPWDFYDADKNPIGATSEIVAVLESVIARNAEHPGALHLYIHAVEASKSPELGVAAADRLRDLAPGSGHLVHMPAHIYTRVGRYHDAVVANQKAIASDNAYLALCRPQPGAYPLAYVPHNHHFIWWAASMQGSSEIAIAAAEETAKITDLPELMQLPDLIFLQDFLVTPLKARVQFGRWDEILAMPTPAPELPYPQAIWNFAQGMAHVAKGDTAAAERNLEVLSAVAADPRWEAAMIGPKHPLSGALRIAQRVLAAKLAASVGDAEQAAAMLQDAVGLEDGLAYFEPPVWHQPIRQLLGAVQLQAGQAEVAEQTYRVDLANHPRNGWSLFGLAQALRAQGKDAEAQTVEGQFKAAWAHADVDPQVSRL